VLQEKNAYKEAFKITKLPSCVTVVSTVAAGKIRLLLWRTLFQTPLLRDMSKKESNY